MRGDDCDDFDPTAFPGSLMERCDGADQDCDGFRDNNPAVPPWPPTAASFEHGWCSAIAMRLSLPASTYPTHPRCVFPGHPWSDYAATTAVVCMACTTVGGSRRCDCWNATSAVPCP